MKNYDVQELKIMIRGKGKSINIQITVTATYEDSIRISLYDTDSCLTFIEMELTREQFINATMNRLGNCDVETAVVRSLELVGKKREGDTMEFKLPDGTGNQHDRAVEEAMRICPDGWEPATSFSSQESFFTKNGERWARTPIVRWV
jgi:hypothetical protein